MTWGSKLGSIMPGEAAENWLASAIVMWGLLGNRIGERGDAYVLMAAMRHKLAAEAEWAVAAPTIHPTLQQSSGKRP
jgi:hypothetical protein